MKSGLMSEHGTTGAEADVSPSSSKDEVVLTMDALTDRDDVREDLLRPVAAEFPVVGEGDTWAFGVGTTYDFARFSS